MMTRLVLVGLVAALGVTLPSRPDCDRWIASTQTWACGLLANWDTWEPNESEAYCLPTEEQQIAPSGNAVARIQQIGDRRILEASAAEPSKPEGHQESATVTVLVEGEQTTGSVHSKAMNGEWNVVSPTDQIDLAMVVELYRIAEQTGVERRQEPTKVEASTVAPPALVQTAVMLTLPSQVFALGNRGMRSRSKRTAHPLPTEVFVPKEPRIEVQAMMVQSLPTDVFAPAEQRSEVQIAEFRALPDDVFAPADRRIGPPWRSYQSRRASRREESRRLLSRAAALRRFEIGEIDRLDPDLDVLLQGRFSAQSGLGTSPHGRHQHGNAVVEPAVRSLHRSHQDTKSIQESPTSRIGRSRG